MGIKLSPHRFVLYQVRCLFVLWVLLLLTSGCMANYGSMEQNREIYKLFETYQVLPGYTYYYTGGQNNPTVIMGIHKDYTMTTRSWTPMGPLTSDTLKKRIDGMDSQIGQWQNTYGWVILSPAGEKVGIWYSRLGRTAVKFGENKEISVSQPRQDDPDDRRRLRF
jgi:hypothetical protein